MAYTLAEYAKITPREFDTMVFSRIAERTPLLERLLFHNTDASSFKFNKETTLSTTAYRAFGGTVSGSSGTNTETTVAFSHAAGLVFLDQFTDAALRDDAIRKGVDSMALQVNETMFTGDGTSNSFNGWENLVTAGQTVAQTNGGALQLAQLDEAINGTRGTDLGIFMNASMFQRFQTAARTQAVAGNVIYAPNEVGKWSMTYNGIPLYKAGEDSSGNQILPFSETQGTETSATSIYLMDFSEGVRGLQKTGLTSAVKEAAFGENLEFSWDVACYVPETRGLSRIAGVTDAAITA